MKPRQRMVLLIVIMAIIAVIVDIIALGILYRVSLAQQRERLEETVKSQARLLEAVARFDKEHAGHFPRDARQAAISQMAEAHRRYEGFGTTGEFTLARLDGDHIDYVLSHRHYDLANLKPLPLASPRGEPMKAALAGRSGTMIGLDYRGERVLAAFEPVPELDLGMVAKIDIAEIRRPFLRAMAYSGAIGVVVILVGAGLFFYLTNPLIERLERTNQDLQSSLDKVKQLSGMLPICASCKKVRDDRGYWNQIEAYIRDHSEAEFSHGICPECMKELYPAYAARILPTRTEKE